MSFKKVINQEKELFEYVLKQNKNFIILAGASSSGKSFFAKKLKDFLTSLGKKVLLISCDNFYKDLTTFFAYLYGTFDHPNLIDFKELNQVLEKILEGKEVKIPIYSFEDHMRVGYKSIKGTFDFIIVEGLYTLEFLKKEFLKQATKIFVFSSKGELIVRRLLRDPSRTKESLEKILSKLINVFPMWKIFGEKQKSYADVIFVNNYEIIKEKGEGFIEKYINLGEEEKFLRDFSLVRKESVTSYYYKDENKDTFSIKEHYFKGKFYKVSLSKREILDYKPPLKIKSYFVSFKEPGMFSQIHILMQIANLKFVFLNKKEIEIYTNKENKIIILERFKGSNKLKILISI